MLEHSMRLLFVSPSFPPQQGGVPTYGYELSVHLNPMVSKFAVIAPMMKHMRAIDKAMDFPIYRVPHIGDNFALSGVPAVVGIALRGGYDTIFCSHLSAGYAGLVAQRLGAAKQVFVAVHGKEIFLKPFPNFSLLQRGYDGIRDFVFDHATKFFPVSAFSAELLVNAGIERSRIHVVHNGVSLKRFFPVDALQSKKNLDLPTTHPIILTVARLIVRKGIDTTLRALVHVKAKHPTFTYVIVGNGPDRKRLEGMVTNLGLESNVIFRSDVNDDQTLRTYYNACDVFVLPARSEVPDVEGFGLVLLEASACAKPVVAARSGGVVDAVQNGITGYLIDPPADATALADHLVELILNKAQREKMGTAGLDWARDRMTWQHTADHLLASMTVSS
jgi:phosphatidylinositol alpha-1,6-mannosyltransferase